MAARSRPGPARHRPGADHLRDARAQPWLLEVGWRLVVLDEAQAIKNPAARQTKTVKRLKADARIVLTGTPVENRLSDLWSLFDFLCPGLLGSQEKFKKFVKTLEARRAEPLCAAAHPGAALHPPAAEDRQAGHRRPAGQDGSPGLLRAFASGRRPFTPSWFENWPMPLGRP